MISFPIPEGFVVPDGVEVGASFDAVATLTLTDEGTLELTAIDGATVGEGEKEAPAQGGADQGNFLDAVSASLAQ